jgi:hypothetical protein
MKRFAQDLIAQSGSHGRPKKCEPITATFGQIIEFVSVDTLIGAPIGHLPRMIGDYCEST